jgi:RHS repeat-associated protein
VVGSSYNLAGQRTQVMRPNSVTTTYGYDAAGRLTGITHAGSGGTLQSFGYTLDAAGNRTAMTTNGVTESYGYDALNRLTNVTYGTGDTTAFTYDPQGNRLTQTVNGVLTNSYTYDAADQLVSDGTRSFTYDAAGNLLSAGSESYGWDWANRLTSATVNGTMTSYSYDGDGVRVSATAGAVTTPYVWDRVGELPLLVSDGTTRYVHAGGILAEIDASNAARFHLTDALSSVRGVTDGTGTLVGTSDYAAFGAVRSTSGTTSRFGYTGEQTDPETGNVFLRARYLDPELGRVVSMDTVQPNAPGTEGYNRCSYVANNPATWSDPSGHDVVETGRQYLCSFMVNRVITNMIGIDLFAIAKGMLLGTHRKGAYLILISAAVIPVGLGIGAERLLGDTRGVRAGEAIAGGLLVANSLAIAVAVFGVPHMSIAAFFTIPLAGVLLLHSGPSSKSGVE